jgi:polysaccharide biosynthesis protein PslG
VLRRCLAFASLLSAVIALASAAPALAAKRKVPFGFFGVNVVSNALTGPGGDAQARLMVQSGVESVRVVFDWSAAQPVPGPIGFAQTDQVVRVASARGLRVLPIVMYAPAWASTAPGAINARLSVRSPSIYAAYAAALVARYGPRGSFWAENPALPRRPLREWQIWNEPAASYFWASRPYARTYPRLLRAAAAAIHRSDGRAKVVLGGLNSTRKSTSWDDLDRFYRAGLKRSYDVLALHPFSLRLDRRGVLDTVRRAQAVQRRRRDARHRVWLTEISWPASRGRIARSDYLGFEVSARVQARRLTGIYQLAARERRALRIDRVFWYDWASVYQRRSVGGEAPSFQFSGLNRITIAGLAPMPLLGTYARVARALEGCRKLEDATRCAGR